MQRNTLKKLWWYTTYGKIVVSEQSKITYYLPIGSGEIESGYRYIIQNMIKITGAWWLEDNAESMANLSAHRANKNWDQYWKNKMAS